MRRCGRSSWPFPQNQPKAYDPLCIHKQFFSEHSNPTVSPPQYQLLTGLVCERFLEHQSEDYFRGPTTGASACFWT